MSIDVTGVTKKFGDFVALDNVTVTLPTGQLTALLGPSGGGKSTLLRIIAGLDKADSGTVSIEGTDATRLPPQKRNVGFVFQHYAVFKHMTVAKNVAFGLEIRKQPKDEVAHRVDELLRLVHLQQFSHRLPSQLSGGQRQRMALARALAVEPKVLLLDEPFGALDAKVRKELREWLRRLHDEVHVTTVFVTHDQEEALEVSDEIVVINDGRVEQIGSPDELYDNPANDFVMGFLGEVTHVNGEAVRPHDVDISTTPILAGAAQGIISRILRVGFEVRVSVLTDAGEEVAVQLTKSHANVLGLDEGQTVWVTPTAGLDPLDGEGGLTPARSPRFVCGLLRLPSLSGTDESGSGRQQLVDRRVVVGQHGGVADPRVERGAVDERPARDALVEDLLDGGEVELAVGGHDHQVAAATRARVGGDVVRLARQDDVVEDLGQGRHLGPREGQGAVVDQVGDVHAVGRQHAPYVAHRLTRGQVPRHADPAERVADHEVAAVVGEPAQPEPAVLDPHLEQRPGPQLEPLAVDLDDAGVDLGDEVVGPGAHVGEVPGRVSPPPPRW